MSMRNRLLSSTVLPLVAAIGVGATVMGCASQADTGGSYRAVASPCNPCAATNPIGPCGPCNPCAAAKPCNPSPVKIPDSPCEPAYEG